MNWSENYTGKEQTGWPQVHRQKQIRNNLISSNRVMVKSTMVQLLGPLKTMFKRSCKNGKSKITVRAKFFLGGKRGF